GANIHTPHFAEHRGKTKATGAKSTNVRYASACRRPHQSSTEQEWHNECPIRFSLSSTSPTLTATEMTQRMSDTLQLVVDDPTLNSQSQRNRALAMLHCSFSVECRERRRQR